MSNTLGPLIGPIYDSLSVVSREPVGFVPSVARDNADFTRAAVGQSVVAFVVPPAVAYDIIPGVIPPNDGDNVFDNFQITLDKAKYVPIKWNGEEQKALNNSGSALAPMLAQQFQQAYRTLINAMETDLALKAVLAGSRACGTPGTTPFGVAGDLSDFALPAQILDDNGAPQGGRSIIVNSPAMANLRGRQSVLFKTNEAGTDDLLRRGKVGMVEGFGIGNSTKGLQPNIAGSGAGFVTTSANPAGTVLIAVGSGTGTILPGNVVSFAGDGRKYVVKTYSGGILNIGKPGLQAPLASGSAVTVEGTYSPNVAFSQDALLLATRPPARPISVDGTPGDMADDMTLITDEVTGITFELSVYRGYRQIKFELGVVWGTAAVNPDHIAILRG